MYKKIDVPHDFVNVKIDTTKLKDFQGICKLQLVIANTDAYVESVNIEYPYIRGGFRDGATSIGDPWGGDITPSKGVPEPFMPKK